MRTSSLIAPCCDRCTHRPGSPCRDLIKCISEGPICHKDDACAKSRQALLAKVRRGGEGTLIFVGAGTCGRANGSTKVIARIGEFLKERNIAAEIIEVGCVGYCQRELFIDVQLPDSPRIAYADINPGNIDQFLDEVFVKNNLRNGFLYARHGEAGPSWSDIPEINSTDFFKRQVKVVLRNAGIIDPGSLDSALAAGAFKSAARALCAMTPEEVCNEVLASGLRGRGGAGFPTGQKWNIARQTPRAQKYLICNADEGDPGAFMDRAVLESDPFFVLEGMLIAAYAIGASKGYIYCRAEYPLAIERLTQAIAQCRRVGLLGNNILGSLFSFDITIKQGAGAFVCGEETAILASIEGGRGMPRPRPPYPAIAGLHGKPTVLNNVETLANVPVIIDRGAQFFQDLGLGKAAGTKVFALSGTIRNTGLVEVPVGIKLGTIVEDIGGGALPGHRIKAVQMGGPSGGCVPSEYFDTPTDYGSLIELGAMMGSGGMVVMDERTCMVDVARFFMEFIRNESCGKCTPCREGTTRMLEILTSITERPVGDEEKRLERIRGVLHIEELASTVKEASLCGLGQTAANPVLSTLRYFRHEYEAHVIDQRCPAGQCQGLAVYEVDNATCIGCLICKKSCPSNAIVGERKQAHYIIVDRCIGCGTCVTACPKHSIHMVQPGEEERASV
jgi:NADH:ubiquinone oxidoreductase subunit F (NADH-binding)/Pyruvate/2-oxoacid:ferredoxin oxidoreductase delta subunit